MKPFAGKTPNASRPKGARNVQYQADLAKRRAEAGERKAVRDALTPQQQLARLDTLFGVGQGAKKERARLGVQTLRIQNAVSVVTVVVTDVVDPEFKPLDAKKLGKKKK